ncbi:MAG TPA: 2-hydroxyacyl-CoA dehydratase family protein [Thermodesulfobacteriota bacterium]|nr:2-hydroxyacyl-CoA dehydratase [Deltaproteobacteria bacterium]HNU72474.1 2-hydroxyacyl-CoA dehydratase family protein [Thermodesulfobacteriota bacterium]HQO77071.1 2-hydroxyacyl-CoA dehydratase family protein [Thermodesulfobacteriota bacterium]
MAEAPKEEKKESRRKATKAAALIGPMVKEFIKNTHQAKAEGKKLAFTFICCHYDEIIRAMDIVPVWVENYAGICGAKRDAERFLSRAEVLDFSRSLCTYALCGIGFDQWREELGEMPPNAPWGGQVKPDFMLSSGQILCDPRNKWFQAAQQYMPEVPIFNLGMPWPLFEQDVNVADIEPYYVKYICSELKSLIGFLEQQTGKKMDYDRLSELVDLTERTWTLIWETYELRRAIPTPMDTGDAMNTMVPITFMMSTQQGYDFFIELNKELKEKIAIREGVSSDEKYRLLWGGGLPSWFALNDFNYFNSRGAVFPAETTYRLIEPMYRLNLPNTQDPIERIAYRWFRYWTYWFDKAKKRPGSEPDVERLIQYIEDYTIDGVVMHEAFSCRTWHLGLIWQLNQLNKIYKPIPTLVLGARGKNSVEHRELPSLILESDIIDISTYSEVETRKQIDAFIETLDAVKRQGA